MIEVEIKARIKDIEGAKKSLEKEGAQFVKTEKQVDSVFGHPSMLDENRMIIEGGYSARVREKNGTSEVTFKEILRGKGGIEINAPVGNLELGRKFLNSLGFQEAFTVIKSREVYRFEKFEICLDQVEQLGNFIEVERIVSSVAEKEEARNECQKFLDGLKIENEIVLKGYGDLMQEIINQNKT